jgi:Mg2+ and Co2+ transporter CorA
MAQSVPAGKSVRDQERKPATKQAEGLRAFLYDADARDKEVDLSPRLAGDLREDQLLWVDVDLSSEAAVEQLRTLIELGEEEFSDEARLPVRERGDYFSFTVPTLVSPDDDAELTPLTCVVETRWVVTAHHGTVAFLDAFDEHVHSDSSLGHLDAPNFIASLLEWELNDFYLAIDAGQRAVDGIEEEILGDKLNDRSLDELVGRRRRLSHIRSGLGPHRYVYATLAHRSFDVVSGTDAAGDFALLSERVEQAIQSTESAREMIVGAFDLYMTRTAQRTNDVMKVLTVISALLLPAALIAGIFGMNMLPDFFMHQWFFWVVVVLMIVVSGGLLTILFRRGWL